MSKMVSFSVDTKPPNTGAMKIHTKTNKREKERKPELIKTDDVLAKDIQLIISQTNVSYEVAIKVYRECEDDLVNAIMFIIENNM
jgi:NACalpha-BTF3-like transcription factor